jgi:hypothetical protein
MRKVSISKISIIIIMFIVIMQPVQASQVSNFFSFMFSDLIDTLKNAISGAPTNVAPAEQVRIGDNTWKDVTCLLSKDNKFLGHSNQKYRGSAKITIIAGFDSSQRFKVKGYKEMVQFTINEPNKGKDASVSYEKIDQKNLKDALAIEGLNDYYDRFVNLGTHFYKIIITAPDEGYHASYVVSMKDPATIAFAKGETDDEANPVSRVFINVPATRSESDKQVTCKSDGIIFKLYDIDKDPLTEFTVNYKKDTKSVNIDIKDTNTYTFSDTTIPASIRFKVTIDGERAAGFIKNPEEGNIYSLILATESQRISKYKEHLTEYGKIIWGNDFNVEEKFEIRISDEYKEFQTNPITDTVMNRYGIIYFGTDSIPMGIVETPYHEGAHALWEKMSIDGAGGDRVDIWKPLPTNKENEGLVYENFALDEAQAHLQGYYGKKYYDFISKEESGFSIEKAKEALKDNSYGNEIEGVVTTLFIEGYDGKEYTEVLKDMVMVKKSYHAKHGQYPQHIGQFLSEKLALSKGEELKKWKNLADELNIHVNTEPGNIVVYDRENSPYSGEAMTGDIIPERGIQEVELLNEEDFNSYQYDDEYAPVEVQIIRPVKE